jgi:hypothetical protein
MHPVKSVEDHKHLLDQPSDDTLLYKIIPWEYFSSMQQQGYLYFRRVDTYEDDKRDSDQPDGERIINQKIFFEKAPTTSLNDLYNRYRGTSYACSFSITPPTAEHRIKYGGRNPEKAVCLVFRFGELRKFLNEIFINTRIVTTEGGVLHDFIPAHVIAADGSIISETQIQLFHIDYGRVKYGDFNKYIISDARPNPIEYAFFKDEKYRPEDELRVLVSHNAGIGKAAVNGELFNFHESLQFGFNFDQALKAGAIIDLDWKN